MTARTTTTLLLTISDMLLLHCVYRSRCLAKSRLLLCLQESSQIEADTCLWMQTTFVVARTRTKQEGKVCCSQGTSDRLACKSFFFSLWIEPRAKDAELFVSEPKRTSLLFSGFAKKFKIISCFLYIHVLRIISSRHTFWARTTNKLLQVQPWFLQLSFYRWGAVGALPDVLVSYAPLEKIFCGVFANWQVLCHTQQGSKLVCQAWCFLQEMTRWSERSWLRRRLRAKEGAVGADISYPLHATLPTRSSALEKNRLKIWFSALYTLHA